MELIVPHITVNIEVNGLGLRGQHRLLPERGKQPSGDTVKVHSPYTTRYTFELMNNKIQGSNEGSKHAIARPEADPHHLPGVLTRLAVLGVQRRRGLRKVTNTLWNAENDADHCNA